VINGIIGESEAIAENVKVLKEAVVKLIGGIHPQFDVLVVPSSGSDFRTILGVYDV